MSGDPYLYPGSQTLRNHFDIRDADRLERAERVLSRFAARRPLAPPPDMTPEGLQRIHRHLFGAIYPWAGEFRTINLEKIVVPASAGTDTGKTVTFEHGLFVKPNVQRFFAELGEDGFLRGLDGKTFAYRAAVYLEDLNFIHPSGRQWAHGTPLSGASRATGGPSARSKPDRPARLDGRLHPELPAADRRRARHHDPRDRAGLDRVGGP